MYKHSNFKLNAQEHEEAEKGEGEEEEDATSVARVLQVCVAH
jgi:hypothetical protein